MAARIRALKFRCLREACGVSLAELIASIPPPPPPPESDLMITLLEAMEVLCVSSYPARDRIFETSRQAFLLEPFPSALLLYSYRLGTIELSTRQAYHNEAVTLFSRCALEKETALWISRYRDYGGDGWADVETRICWCFLDASGGSKTRLRSLNPPGEILSTLETWPIEWDEE